MRHRIGEVPIDQAIDPAVERGREEHRLVDALHAVEDLLHLGQESHVGHAIGLVEHQDLHRRERQFAALHEVDQPTRGADQHIEPPLERFDLGVHSHAAVERGDAEPERLAQGLQHLPHLVRELAGGHEHQTVGLAWRGLLNPVEQWQTERQRLAGPGLGLPQHVTAREGVGNGEGLNCEGLVDALGAKRVGERGRDAEIGERRSHVSLSIRGSHSMRPASQRARSAQFGPRGR